MDTYFRWSMEGVAALLGLSHPRWGVWGVPGQTQAPRRRRQLSYGGKDLIQTSWRRCVVLSMGIRQGEWPQSKSDISCWMLRRVNGQRVVSGSRSEHTKLAVIALEAAWSNRDPARSNKRPIQT